jgi:hypothetical protein
MSAAACVVQHAARPATAAGARWRGQRAGEQAGGGVDGDGGRRRPGDAAELDHRPDQRLELERAAVLHVLQHRGLVRAHRLGAGDALVQADLELDAQLRPPPAPRHHRAASARVGGKRQMSSSVACVSALIGLKLRLPHSLTQISPRMSGHRRLEAGAHHRLRQRLDARLRLPSSSPSVKRLPSMSLTTPGATSSAAG